MPIDVADSEASSEQREIDRAQTSRCGARTPIDRRMDASPQPPQGHLRHVLVVDDEALARESLGAILEERYRVTLAGRAEEAVALLQEDPASVICTDFQMPGMNGLELLRRAAKAFPQTVGVLVTGFPDLAERGARREDDRYLLLVKPFTPDGLLRIVAQAVHVSEIRSIRSSKPSRSGSAAL